MKRTKGKLSPWQSGTIAPKFPGLYEYRQKYRKEVNRCLFVDSGWHIPLWVDGKTGACTYYEQPLKLDGANFFWRGIIEDE